MNYITAMLCGRWVIKLSAEQTCPVQCAECYWTNNQSDAYGVGQKELGVTVCNIKTPTLNQERK